MESSEVEAKTPKSNKVNFSLDLRLVVFLLIAVIIAMLIVWKPWITTQVSDDRTVTVTGQSVVTAEPDEFVFYPTYEIKNDDKSVALSEVTQKSDEVVSKLKELGVPDSKIKTNSSGYEYSNYGWYYDKSTGENRYTLQLTVSVDDKEQAQKVQDFLVTTEPTGSVSPQADFSDKKRNELEAQARDEATKDARAKAEQSAKNIGFKIGKVKSVTDGTGFGEIMPMTRNSATMEAAPDDSKSQLAVQSGENNLDYSVTVIYYIR